jgi:hypothetical protein
VREGKKFSIAEEHYSNIYSLSERKGEQSQKMLMVQIKMLLWYT